MNIYKLFSMCFAPADDLSGGGGADPAAGGGNGADAGATAGGEAAGPSLEDTARETYRTLMAEGESAAGETDAGDEAGKPAGKQRGPDGKFVKGEGAAPDGQQAAKPEGEQQTLTQAKPHDAYPNTWRKELGEAWKTLPEPVRQEIHKREQDFHNGVKQYRDAAGFGQTIATEMLPYREIMQKANVTPQVIVRDIMGALNTMATGSAESKADTFLKLATQYGINLDTVMSLRQRAPSQAAPDFSPVIQRMEKLETRITEADQERERLQNAEYENTALAFLNDPKNEHAWAVKDLMKGQLLSGQAQNLQEAYEQAIWGHPETRAKLLEKQEADRRKKEAEEVAAAKKASAANVTRRGTPPAPAKAGTLEDTARSTYRRLNGGS